MKKIAIISFIIVLNIFFSYSQDKINVGGGKAAKVNNYVITEEEINNKLNQYLKTIQPGAPKPTRKDVLTELVNMQLISQEIKNQKNLILNEAEFKQALNNVKTYYLRQKKYENPNYEFSEADFKKSIEDEMKVTYEKFQDSIKEQLLFRQYMGKKLQAKLDVIDQKKYDRASDFPVTGYTESGIEQFSSTKDYYEKVKTSKNYIVHKNVELKHIFIAAVQSDGKGGFIPFPKTEKELKKKKAEDILARLKQGESFDKLCDLNSDDTDSRDYADPVTKAPLKGYIGPVFFAGELAVQQKKLYGETLYNQLLTLEKGKYSPVLESPLGYHVFYVIDKKDGGIKTYAEALPQIIQDFRTFDKEKVSSDEMKKLLDDLTKKASIVYYKDEYKPAK